MMPIITMILVITMIPIITTILIKTNSRALVKHLIYTDVSRAMTSFPLTFKVYKRDSQHQLDVVEIKKFSI